MLQFFPKTNVYLLVYLIFFFILFLSFFIFIFFLFSSSVLFFVAVGLPVYLNIIVEGL